MKKIIALILMLMLMLSLAACQPSDSNKIVIGICQIEPHPALDAATKGFMDTLKAKYGDDNIEFLNTNASGDSNTLNTIINDFVAKDVDLILANSTPVLQVAANATNTIPILGTSVTEYGVALDLDNFSGTVGGNISGTSDLAPLDKQADMILEWVPTAKTVGLLYCATEPNSRYQIDKVKEYLESKNLTCKEYSFSSSGDLYSIAETAAASCDVIYVPTDNTVANSTGIVKSVCLDKKVPVIAGEEGICSGCGIATLCISYYELGVTTANMAIKVLDGTADISQMPIEYADPKTVTAKYNAEICTELGITPLKGYIAIGE